jgi:hypothetical protein
MVWCLTRALSTAVAITRKPVYSCRRTQKQLVGARGAGDTTVSSFRKGVGDVRGAVPSINSKELTVATTSHKGDVVLVVHNKMRNSSFQPNSVTGNPIKEDSLEHR